MLDKTRHSGVAQSETASHHGESRAASKLRQPIFAAKPTATAGGASPIADAEMPQPKLRTKPIPPTGGANNYIDVGVHRRRVNQTCTSPDIDVIVRLWRQYQAWLKARVKLELQAQAWCRGWVDGDKGAAAKLWKQVQQLGVGAHAMFDNHSTLSPDPDLLIVLEPFIAGIKMWNEVLEPPRRSERKKQAPKGLRADLEKRAAETSYYKLIPKGFGAFNLAGLLGSCGDIAGYRNPSCLWKRMGLGVIDGERQRKCTDPERAIIHGYSPRRCSLAWNIGECLIKAKSPVKAVYDERKAKKIADGWSKLHAHRDAKRYMVKRVLRDLWVASQRHPVAELAEEQ